MAQESSQEKTESPTERRREELRNEGRVAYSRELTGGAILSLVVLGFYFAGNLLTNELVLMLKKSFSNIDIKDFTAASVGQIFLFSTMNLFFGLLLFVAMLFFFGFLVGVVQTGFRITLKPIQPDFKK